MEKSKLIVCVCGAGINTSSNAKMTIVDYLDKEGIYDIKVKHVTLNDLVSLRNRGNMVIVWMTQVDDSFDEPSFKGLPYLIRSRKAKQALTKDIIAKMEEIYKEKC